MDVTPSGTRNTQYKSKKDVPKKSESKYQAFLREQSKT